MQGAAQSMGGDTVGTRRAAQTQIDTSRIQRLQCAELFRHHERRMIGQHNAPRTDPYGLCATGNMADDYRRGGAGDTAHVVMFGHPVAVITRLFAVLGQRTGIVERLGCI